MNIWKDLNVSGNYKDGDILDLERGDFSFAFAHGSILPNDTNYINIKLYNSVDDPNNKIEKGGKKLPLDDDKYNKIKTLCKMHFNQIYILAERETPEFLAYHSFDGGITMIQVEFGDVWAKLNGYVDSEGRDIRDFALKFTQEINKIIEG